MYLTKKSKSMFNMFDDESKDKLDDDNKSKVYKLKKKKEKVIRNATDDEKKENSKVWDKMLDERIHEDPDVVTIKEAEKKFDSCSDFISFTDCGEPEKAQFISIDFTPEEGLDDNKDLLKKCISFWKFIEKHPELQSLRAEPEDLEAHENSFVSRSLTPVSTKSSYGMDLSSCPSSIAMLASTWLKKQDLMSNSLAAKTALTKCRPESLQYPDYQIDAPAKKRTDKKTNLHACQSVMRIATSVPSLQPSKISIPSKPEPPANPHAYRPVDDLDKILADMQDFDMKHEDNYDPPGHPPSLIHAELVRARSILPYIKTGRG